MKLNQEICTGCGKCIKFCPMRSISLQEKKARIATELCAECGVCYRLGVCESGALQEETQLPWPRSIRSILSNPLTEFKETGVTGRGTEEMKTNDVTGRFAHGQIGFAVDLGRPNIGCTLKDIDTITRAVAQIGVGFEKKNPVTFLMEDTAIGSIREEVLEERVVSGVVEFIVPIEKTAMVMAVLEAIADKVNTVFSVGVICRINQDMTIPVIPILQAAGYEVRPNGKVNIGLGRPADNN